MKHAQKNINAQNRDPDQADQADYKMAWRSNQKKGMYDNQYGLGGGHGHLDSESKQYKKMHAFNYCVKKAGMEHVDEERVA